MSENYQDRVKAKLAACETEQERGEIMRLESEAQWAASHPKLPPSRHKRKYRPNRGADQLAAIPPFEYVEKLCGIDVPVHGKISCPLHEERTASFKVYEDRGWFCYSCHLGGDIYTLAAEYWSLDIQADFPEIRHGLLQLFGLSE